MIGTSTLLMLLVVAAADPPPLQPAARLLRVEGKVAIFSADNQSRPATALDTAYVGERITVSTKGQIVLAFRADGHLERVKPGSEVTVGREGCTPRSAVETVTAPASYRRTVDSAVRQLRPEGPAAAAIVRAPPPPDGTPPENAPSSSMARTPINGSVVLISRPAFTWPAVDKAAGYEFHLYRDTGKIWSVSVDRPKLEYTGEQALLPGTDYDWEVFTVSPEHGREKVSGGFFTTATEDQKEHATKLGELAAGEDIALITLAAAWFDENQMVAEAIAAYERIVRLDPKTASYWRALGSMYQQADREEDANSAFKKADQLRPARRPSFLPRLPK
jgi:hypothetical protein